MVETANDDKACRVDILAVSVSSKAELELLVGKISSLDFPFSASCRKDHETGELLWDDKGHMAVQQTIKIMKKVKIYVLFRNRK